MSGNANASHNIDDTMDISHMRLMRKDDLVVLSPNNKIASFPENFQRNLQKVHLPGGIPQRKMHSVAVDNTGQWMLFNQISELFKSSFVQLIIMEFATRKSKL